MIDPARYRLKPYCDLALLEILQIFENGEREIGIRLNVIQELGVPLAIKRPRLICQAGGGLSFGPLPSVHNKYLIASIATDKPHSDRRHEAGWLSTDCLTGKISDNFL